MTSLSFQVLCVEYIWTPNFSILLGLITEGIKQQGGSLALPELDSRRQD